MEIVGRIENEKVLERWKGVKRDVVLTDERIEHIRERHPEDYALYHMYISEAVTAPDFVIEDADQDSTAMFIKWIEEEGINVIVQLAYEGNSSNLLSSVMTMYRIGTKRLRRLLRNNPVLYRREGL